MPTAKENSIMNSTTKAQILKEFEDTGILRQTTYTKKEVEGELRKLENMISEFAGLPGASKSQIYRRIYWLWQRKKVFRKIRRLKNFDSGEEQIPYEFRTE